MHTGFTYRIASVAALGGLLFGFDTAIINGAIILLKQQFGWTELQMEIAASSLLAGCILGSAIAGALSDAFGRKRILLVSAAIFTLSSLATALPRNLAEFTAARFIGGIAIGIASLLAPLYIAEISPESIRGRLVSLNQFAIVLGILLSYFTGWGLAFFGAGSWRWMFASMAIPSILFLLALIPVPESPRWLVRAGQTANAEQVLTRLGDDLSRIEEIRVALAAEAGASVLQPKLRKPLAIGMLLAVFQQVTGINTILYYGSIIFTEHARAGDTSAALWANVLIGLVNLAFTVVALFTIDRAGRKALLMLAAAGMGASLAILCVLFAAQVTNHTAILACILSYVAFFAVGLGPGVWVVIAELFPTNVRGRAMSVSTVTLWAACLLITSTFLSLVDAITIQGAFGLYAVLCLCTCIFVWRVVPETKGQTLEAIERQWMAAK